jgi:hypothetical protein
MRTRAGKRKGGREGGKEGGREGIKGTFRGLLGERCVDGLGKKELHGLERARRRVILHLLPRRGEGRVSIRGARENEKRGQGERESPWWKSTRSCKPPKDASRLRLHILLPRSLSLYIYIYAYIYIDNFLSIQPVWYLHPALQTPSSARRQPIKKRRESIKGDRGREKEKGNPSPPPPTSNSWAKDRSCAIHSSFPLHRLSSPSETAALSLPPPE